MSNAWFSLAGTLLGGALALTGTVVAWWLARRADLKDRPRRELVPLGSRLLAAVEAVYSAEQDVHLLVFSQSTAQAQTPPNSETVHAYADGVANAKRAHREALTEARSLAGEINLLYPRIGSRAWLLIRTTHIGGLTMRSEAEEGAYEDAREDFMREITDLANGKPARDSTTP